MHILLVEDDLQLGETVVSYLKASYSVGLSRTGKDALYQSRVNEYDLIILDLGLPDMSGLEVCRTLRAEDIRCPILILTGTDATEQKVETLDAGADDYLTKPFKFPELSARIRALLRRSSAEITSDKLELEDLTVSLADRKVTRAGQEIYLRRKEFDLLEYLMRNRGRVVTRSMILEHVWDMGTNLFTNTIDVHIKHLRSKIDTPFTPKLIKTVPGLGYMVDGSTHQKGGGSSE